ncbi:MAG: type II toxin-antitoxin system PemK/MazF family toxin [Bacteroidales bacterium]|nr:type II toxin-antitoxin system PemK/MazF family toxin [Bacteroidales bacterium]
MQIGDIILIPFPFAELTGKKLRPAVVLAQTKDKYKDLIIAAISSVIPYKLGENDILVEASNKNKLRKDSVIKVDRIITLKKEDKVADLGCLTEEEIQILKEKFKRLVD